MPNPLNNVTVNNDSYDDARTVKFQLPVERAFVSVANSAVYARVERVEPGMRVGGGNYLPEEYWLPGITTVNRGYLIGSIQFRRATTVDPQPQVSAR